MRIERIRMSPIRELGEIDANLGSGLIGWAGGTARDRRHFADLLEWSLGLRSATPDLLRGDLPRLGVPVADDGALEGGEVVVRIEGEELHLRAEGGGAPGSESDDGRTSVLHELMGIAADDLSLVWTGGDRVEPAPLWRAGARLLASRWGLGRLNRAVVRLGGVGGSEPGAAHGALQEDTGFGDHTGLSDDTRLPAPAAEEKDPVDAADARAELQAVTARLEELAEVPRRLRELEERLRSLRADHAEVAGDLEVATMDWLRERQDAETHLQQYRDRARELQTRIREMEEAGPEGSCPFCGRKLGDHLDQVMDELSDEWEDLVQDGSWWRRRRDQLELKPDGLQDLERASMRLQAEVEECAERLERYRFELREWDELRDRREELLPRVSRDHDDGEGPWSEDEGAASRRRAELRRAFEAARDELLGEARRRIAREAGPLLNRMSGGRILALVDQEGDGPAMVEDGRIVRGSTVEDRAAATLAVHLGLAVLLRESGVPLDSVLVGETFRGMDPEARVRAVEVLRGLRERIPQIVLLSAGDTVDSAPESFDQILEFRPDRNRPSVKTIPGGIGRLRIRWRP